MPATIRSLPSPNTFSIEAHDLPELSPVTQKLMVLLRNPDVTNRQLASCIEQSGSLTLPKQLMEIANSPFYGGLVKISTVPDAIARIGLRQLYDMVMMTAIGDLYNDPEDRLRPLWDHSIATGVIAHALADELNLDCRSEAFLAGLMHDLGKVLVFQKCPEVFRQLKYQVEVHRRRWWRVEVERFPGLTHPALGAQVAAKWNLPATVVEAIRKHHQLEDSYPARGGDQTLGCIVSVSSALAGCFSIGELSIGWGDVPGLACARYIGLDATHLHALRGRVETLFKIGSNFTGIGLVGETRESSVSPYVTKEGLVA